MTEDSRTSDVERNHLSDDGWALAVSVVLLGAGVVFGNPFLVVLAVMPLGFVAVSGFTVPSEVTVELQRELSFEDDADSVSLAESGTISGDPGERITVRVAVHNEGDTPLVDLRVLDGVPEELPVVDGTHRACLTVRPGESETVEYEVELRQGEHVFGDATVRNRGVGGTVMDTWTQHVSGADALTCVPAVSQAPVDGGANDYAGEIPTDEGGSGVEFYSVREYEPGDPIRSIDWRRYAHSRDVATVEFRAERATRVVCLIDRRMSQKRAESAKHLPALDLSIAAAERTFEATISAGYPTGVIGFGERLQLIVDPGTSPETSVKANAAFDAFRNWRDRADKNVRTHWGSPVESIPRHLPGEAQIILFSSFVDDVPVKLIRQLRVHGYPVWVVSPDVASGRTDTAGRLVASERRTHLAKARTASAQVVDWDVGQPLGVVLDRVVQGVSSR